MSQKKWDETRVNLAIGYLRRSATIPDAVHRMRRDEPLLADVTIPSLEKGILRGSGHRAGEYLNSQPPGGAHARVTVEAPTEKREATVDSLLLAMRKTSTLEGLCDKLNVSPSSAKKLVNDAYAQGYAIQLSDVSIKFGYGDRANEVLEAAPPPADGKQFKLGVISDLHRGSKYCMTGALRDAIGRMYRTGVRDVVIPGDLLDGCYKHGVFELRYSGVEDQTKDFERALPQHEGLRYHAITGNHDFTFTEASGIDVGQYITGHFAKCGRTDIAFYGDRAATLGIGGTTVRLLHPTGSCSYAISYKLQKFVESFDSAEKPGILLVGHYHRSCYIYTRGVHAFAVPTFQGPGSAFGKSLGLGPQAMGGLILSWRLTKMKTIRDMTIRPLSYFRVERPKEVV